MQQWFKQFKGSGDISYLHMQENVIYCYIK